MHLGLFEIENISALINVIQLTVIRLFVPQQKICKDLLPHFISWYVTKISRFYFFDIYH